MNELTPQLEIVCRKSMGGWRLALVTRLIAVSAVLGGCLSASSASAASFILKLGGNVSHIATLNDALDVVATTPGIISVGDDANISIRLDTNSATVTSLFDTDPTINIYYATVLSSSIKIGSYIFEDTPPVGLFATVQLWDGYAIGSRLVDYTGISFGENKAAGARKSFNLGEGQIFENISFDAFDNSAQARNSDLIAEMPSFDLFSSKSLSYGLRNTTTGITTVALFNLTSASVTAVPEPASWALMAGGLGLVGGVLRGRRSNRVLLSS